MSVLTLDECEVSWESSSPEESLRAGEALGCLLRPGDCVGLSGDLGSGKTHFVRGLAAGLGCDPLDVHSPSFTLVNEYACGERGVGAARRWRLAHIDLYRVRSEADLPGIGWDEYVSNRYIVAVEWAERARGSLPAEYLCLRLEARGADSRRICARAVGSRSAQILRDWIPAIGLKSAPA